MDARNASISSILTLIYSASNPLFSMSDSDTSPGPAPKKKPKKSPLAKEWKTPPEPDPGELVKGGETGPSHETLDAYFDPDSGAYYRRNESGEYQKAAIGSIGRYLRKLGFSSKTAEGHSLSPKDRAIERIETHCTVDYAGSLAGYSVGLREIHGRKILVTDSPRHIAPKAGSWETLRAVFEGLLGAEQCGYFYAWLKVAIEALRAERLRPGQALVIAGPPRCGKSLCQALITELLGGREAKPYAAMTGRTDFNSELFGAEHLTIEDEAASPDPRVRKTFGHEIKKVTVNRAQRAHKKNREAFTLFPLWRLTITLNDDAGSLQVLPQLEDGMRDKLTLMKAKAFTMPVDTSQPAGEELLWNSLTAELPAFVHYLLNGFTIPEEWKESRCGVRAYHHPDILELIDATSDEHKLLELIDGFDLWGTIAAEPWEGRAAELEEKLIERYGVTARRLLSFNSACGQYLGLLKAKTDRVTSRILNGNTLWRITPPPSESRS